MFNKMFKVIVVFDNGFSITKILYGKKKDVKNDIEMYKNKSERYEMMGKNGMVVWA